MSKVYTFYDGRFIHSSTQIITERFIEIMSSKNQKHTSKCPFCKEDLTEIGREVYLLINNYQIFPNIFVHKDCYDQRGDAVACSFLEASYLKYKNMLVENAGIWYNEYN